MKGIRGKRRFIILARFLISLVMTLFINNSFPNNYLDFNSRCAEAFELIYNLQLVNGKKLLSDELKENPENAFPLYLENYIDFLVLAIDGNRDDYERLKPNQNERLKQISSLKTTSPWLLHSQAAINLQWAIIKLSYNDYLSSGYDLIKAYWLLEKNAKQFPGFPPDLLIGGVINALLGALPENLSWIPRLAGMNGSIEEARNQLFRLIDISYEKPLWNPLLGKAVFALFYIESNLKGDKKTSGKLIEIFEKKATNSQSPLDVFARATLYLQTGQNEKAINLLESYNKPFGSYPLNHLNYLYGNALLYKLNATALNQFNKYVESHKGSNFVKSAYLRMAWISLLNNNLNSYHHYLTLCKNEGDAITEFDKQALIEASKIQTPNIKLLTTRLLFDGGYYNAALDTLMKENMTLSKVDSVEFLYRLARVYHMKENFFEAERYYLLTIEKGWHLPNYFAGNSALQLGFLNETLMDYEKAQTYYNLCLSLKFDEYRYSIHYKARAGIKRLNNQATSNVITPQRSQLIPL